MRSIIGPLLLIRPEEQEMLAIFIGLTELECDRVLSEKSDFSFFGLSLH